MPMFPLMPMYQPCSASCTTGPIPLPASLGTNGAHAEQGWYCDKCWVATCGNEWVEMAKQYAPNRKAPQTTLRCVDCKHQLDPGFKNREVIHFVRQLRHGVFGHFSRTSPFYTTPRAPCDMFRLLPVLAGC